jgi:hypothetical protein
VWIEYQGLTTVEGPVSVGATLMLEIDPSDPPTPTIQFRADYDCSEGTCTPPCPPYAVGSYCVFYAQSPRDWTLTPLGSAVASPLEFSACAGETCWCLAGAYVTTEILTPLTPGTYSLASAWVSRAWQETNCQAVEHLVAEVLVVCTDYFEPNPECTGGGVFRLLAGAVPIAESTWGKIKALYE